MLRLPLASILSAKRLIKETKNALFHARSGNELLVVYGLGPPAAVGNHPPLDLHVVAADAHGQPIAHHALIEGVANAEGRAALERHLVLAALVVLEVRAHVEGVARAALDDLLVN